jgi:hypothetical protein
MLRIFIACVMLSTPCVAQDAYGSYGSVPMSTQQEQGAYAVTPGPVGTQGQMDDPRLQMDNQTDLLGATSLDATNPQNR